MNRYRHYNTYVLSILAIVFTIVGSFDYLINPYGIFQIKYLKALSQIKPQKINQERLYKAIDIIHLKPKTIILGSSTAGGFQPIVIEKIASQPVYNLKLNGANIYEILSYLEHSHVNQKNLKTVILGLDFFAFNKNTMVPNAGFEEYRLKKTYLTKQDILKATFSLKAFSDSIMTLQENIKVSNKNQKSSYAVRPKHLTKANLKYFVQANRYQNLTISNVEMAYLAKIVKLCKQKNIELKIFISPFHVVQSELINQLGLWSEFEQWKKDITAITPVWDFSGYNSVNTEKVMPFMQNYVDGVHYTPYVSNLIVKRIFNYKVESIPQDFGIYLTKENLNNQIAKLKQERYFWLNRNQQLSKK